MENICPADGVPAMVAKKNGCLKLMNINPEIISLHCYSQWKFSSSKYFTIFQCCIEDSNKMYQHCQS